MIGLAPGVCDVVLLYEGHLGRYRARDRLDLPPPDPHQRPGRVCTEHIKACLFAYTYTQCGSTTLIYLRVMVLTAPKKPKMLERITEYVVNLC